TELTVANTTTVAAAPQATGGPIDGPTVVTGLDLEITSRIEVRAMQAQPAQGTTSATGLIKLTRNADGVWSGTGNLASSTEVTSSVSCQTTNITGDGTYDWVVRDVHAGPELGANLRVGMDSGPTNESPDTVSSDLCGTPSDSTMNTWENLFFDAYRPNYLKNGGFLVDGWTILDPAAWTTGGAVAEAHWSGACTGPDLGLPGMSVKLLDCSDITTFRLIVHVGPATSTQTEGPGPAATSDGGAGATLEPGQTLPPGSGPISGQPPGGCIDFGSCLGQYAIFILIGAVAIVGGGLLAWSRLGGNAAGIPLKAQAPTLGATGSDVAIEPLDLDADKLGSLDADKLGTVDAWKLGDVKLGDGSLSPLEPPGSELPPPPGPTR
ncbi:MAG TPA: hypothetical protein VIF63_08795, partial [Candidatus Limnocylindrales bacterium]